MSTNNYIPTVGIVYHAYLDKGKYVDCHDGIIAASIVAAYYESLNFYKIMLIPDAYQQTSFYEQEENPLLEKFKDVDDVIIVDFSYPRKWIEELIDAGKYVFVFDHHLKRAQEFDLVNFSNALYPENEVTDCAASLVWKYYYPNTTMPCIIKHVRNRDIGLNGYYEGDIPSSEAVNLGLNKIRHEFDTLYFKRFYAKVLYEYIIINVNSLVCKLLGEPEITHRDTLISEFFSTFCNICWADIDGAKVAYLSLIDQGFDDLIPHSSVVANKFLKFVRKHTAINFDCVVLENSSGNLSFRSDGFDTTRISTTLGGGGHTKASGVPAGDNVATFLRKFNNFENIPYGSVL